MAKQGRGILGNPRGKVAGVVCRNTKQGGIVQSVYGEKERFRAVNSGPYGENLKRLGILQKYANERITKGIEVMKGQRGGIIPSALKVNRGNLLQSDSRVNGYQLAKYPDLRNLNVYVRQLSRVDFFAQFYMGITYGYFGEIDIRVYGELISLNTMEARARLDRIQKSDELRALAVPRITYESGLHLIWMLIENVAGTKALPVCVAIVQNE